MSEGVNYVTYCLLRCVDEVRDEALNVGIVALDAMEGRIAVRVTTDLTRIARTLPNVPLRHLEAYLPTLSAYFTSQARRRVLTPEILSEIASKWGNGVRLSSLRSIAGANWEETCDSLFNRYVAGVSHALRQGEASEAVPSSGRMTVTSRRLMRTVVSRLRRRGFREHVEIERDAEVVGITRASTQVPVWFPLLVTRQLLVDAMKVHPHDPQRSLDGARLLAAKAGEVFRASEALAVSFVVGASGNRRLDATVESVILDEGRTDKRSPSLYWDSEVERFAAAAPQHQLTIPFTEASASIIARTSDSPALRLPRGSSSQEPLY